MKKIFFAAIFFASIFLSAQESEFAVLEAAVYAERAGESEILSLFGRAVDSAANFSPDDAAIFKSNCEELLGRFYLNLAGGDVKSDFFAAAKKCFKRGIALADGLDGAAAKEALVKNMSQSLQGESVASLVSNGLKMSGEIKALLKASPDSLWGLYFDISQDVFAPKAFADGKGGKKKAEKLLEKSEKMSPALKFNVLMALAKANILLKSWDDAKAALDAAAAIFPQNSELAEFAAEIPSDENG